ncbi:low temperature requirement protein A [Limosilactobacillus sp.]|uniref:low temperature requirement protein A n=1 Tax=Limosilactobacillus sp. TaxID=2773925 RepID=UPI003F050316
MKAIVAKRVSMLELFYDLIFVYAISRITAMIHYPAAGGLPVLPYLEFAIVVIIVMQIWLYQALYINRFGESRLVDNIGLLISMYAMTYLANNINTEWSTTFRTFNTAVLLIVANLIWQYLCGSGSNPLQDRGVRAFTITLSLEFIAVLAGLVIGYRYGIYLCVLGGLIGFLMPLTIYRQFVPDKVNFPHLVERLSLIIIITFGEMLVNVTRYFTGTLVNPLALAIFAFVAALFGTYIIQSELLINHHQQTRGFVLMYSHVFTVVALLSMTAGLDYLTISAVSQTFLWVFLSVGLIAYYICLYFNGVYNRRGRLGKSDYCWLALILVVGISVAFAWRRSDLGIVCGLALASLGQCGYLLFKIVPRK